MKKIPVLYFVAVGVLVASAAAWFFLVRPLGTKVHDTDAKIAAQNTALTTAQADLAKAQAPVETTIKVADLVELAKAMPDDPDLANAVLELNAMAKASGVDFSQVTPGAPALGAGYVQLPMTLSFVGNYYDLTDLLYRLRNLVTVRNGVLDAQGRLYTLDQLNWHEAPQGFPIVQADLTVSAYVYGSDGLPTATAGTTASGTTDTTSTGTSSTTTTSTTTPSTTGGAAPSATTPASTAPTTTTPSVSASPQAAPEVNP